MTVENLEANGNQATEAPASESLALSVPHKTTLPNNRPVEPSHLEVVRTYSSVGSNRPVTKSGIAVSNTLAISGNRPIALSTLNVSDTYVVMGNRPVASNEIDDSTTLMGYID
jgi:hypothetical protein